MIDSRNSAKRWKENEQRIPEDQMKIDYMRLPPLRIGSLLTCRPGCGVEGGGAPIVNRAPPGGGAAGGAPNGDVGCAGCPLPKVNVPGADGARFA
jgi:hypothetical protein